MKNKQYNAITGTQFEAAVVKQLDKNGVVQWTKPIEPEIRKDGITCAQRIIQELDLDGNIKSVYQCGQHTSTQSGDIVLTDNNNTEYRLEMKYVSDNSTGTWHNTSADLFIRQLPGHDFLTINDALNKVPMKVILNGELEIQVSSNLIFKCDPKKSFNETMSILFEPFEPFDILLSGSSETDDMTPDSGANSPLGSTHTATIQDNYESVILIRTNDGLYTRLLADDEYDKYFKEEDELDELDEFDDEDEDYNDQYELSNGSSWVLIDTEESVINPAMIYEKVLKVIGNKVMGYIGLSHFNTIMKDPTLPQQVLSLFCDKKEASDKMKNGKRPDYLIAFSKSSGKASIFNCQNYQAGDSDEIQFHKLTNNRYTIGNSNVAFAFQYAWGGGAGIKNPVIRVFLQH